MTTEQIFENNKIIAELMNYKPFYLSKKYDRLGCYCDEIIEYSMCQGLNEAENHGYCQSSWNWLIPVVMKVEDFLSTYISDLIGNNYGILNINDDEYNKCINTNSFVKLYTETVEAIKFCNNLKTLKKR